MQFDIVDIVLGLGIITMLWSIKGELGCIKATLNTAITRGDDHENRIRVLEQAKNQ